ncbi:cytochrome b/b6 domain-containing protein [Sulfitobacter mediterraneus]|uniref:cytochrome b/b6 domain-containing protein n=1 Tax=Sulfitobacter mediterraneus TaxID=83219 RepID=UPI0019317720|nr:cytochrome b/b6 domain-containing protein [Sulfitobacter mediterraneus]MBM1309807.1 cytochrome b/b6 domain-containing protein [Sulfitobacter mediterraneus]MBM1313692.1 cytochrome b/b6 domain-containing protein [Sulfitobacter mediterraneus]MBM1322076.1 cytochrome b/b6 domain-containing protein [Sulfitobacter mediterraneus]MBM1325963.1 cytochrome b/b6 domain-containing protein [Sulfitobacter mediterraneus]MBM1397309.1 cytochrome b/b6 domain-containing protein [Sulfitobacter mediterraneus]
MSVTNTQTRYGAVTKAIHWLMALLILSLIPMGWIAHQLPFDTDAELARKAWLFSLHKTLGVLAFFVAAVRIIWAISQPKPGLLNADKKLESWAADTVHWMLYAAMVVVPLSGWISHAAAAGFAPIWWPFGQGLPMVPKSTAVEHFFGALHWVSGRLLILSLLLHIAGAVKHHLIDRDATLRRMLPGRPDLAPLPDQTHSRTPVMAAIALWLAALGLSAAMAGGKTEAAPEALAEVTSQWQVETGNIEIAVVQFGSEITGSFADWTSVITFDETVPSADITVGSVETMVSIPSLTLGSVTGQALGPDFFAATDHPTAVFKADIRHASDGYEAIGTLTIKDQTAPLTLPFGLSVDGNRAEMRGDLTLDRRSFGIGDNVNDPATLGFEVRVKITLTAVRSAE